MTTVEMILDMSVKEYELLRAEVVTTVERQYSLANWGVSAVAVITATVIGAWQTVASLPALMSVFLDLIMPALATAYAISWSHTITKLNQLGARLFEIEENIAHSCRPEVIRSAFSIPEADEIRPYRYTIGWEHALWKDGVNNRIQTTIRVVAIVLAIFFLLLVTGAGVYMAWVGVLSHRVVFLVSIACGLFWGGIWLAIFCYLHRRTIDTFLPHHCLHRDAGAGVAPLE